MSSDQEETYKQPQSRSPFSASPAPPPARSSPCALFFEFKVKVAVVAALAIVLLALAASNSYYNSNRIAAAQLAAQLPHPLPSTPLPSISLPREDPLAPQANLKVEAQKSPVPSEEAGSESFSVPRQVWIYAQQNGKETFFEKLSLQNIRHFAELSYFTVNLISARNYHQWVSEQRQKSIGEILDKVRKDKGKEDDEFEQLREELIGLSVLHENGGVLIAKDLLLTEDFTWISEIAKNPYVNRGSRQARPQYFGFFDINAGSIVEPVNKEHATRDCERFMVRFPGIKSNFLVGVKLGEFLESVLEEYKRLILSQKYLESMISAFDLQMGKVSKHDRISRAFTIAAHIVLQVKQFEISKSFPDSSKVNRFAVDDYGVFTINQRFFVTKIANIFDSNFEQKVYRNLANYRLAELEQTTGPLRYVCDVIFKKKIGEQLERLLHKKGGQKPIHPQSFIARFLLLGREEYSGALQKEVERPVVNATAKRWDALPKIVWLFWNTGFKRASIGNRLCIENLRRSAEAAGFEVREVNNSNIVHYIGKETNDRFDQVIKNRKIPTFPQTKSNFVRKAIIYKYGGVYMDVSFIALESLEWILNIAQYPSEYIFNRYGELPRVLMFFHPHYGQPFKWEFDARANTKRQDLTAYENNFIIAEPNHELLAEWIDEYALTITSDYKETQARMDKYGVRGSAWTNPRELYLTSMDSLKNVVGRRQVELDAKARREGYEGPRSASEYYGIWSISGYRGQQKIRGHTNLENSYYRNPRSSDNVFLYRYSQEYTEGVLGRANQMFKLYNWSVRHFNELLDREFDSNFSNEIHPHSYCMRYLVGPVRDRIHKNADILILRDQ